MSVWDFAGTALKEANSINPAFGFLSGLSGGISSGLSNLISWEMSGKKNFTEQQEILLKNQLEALSKQYGYSSQLSKQGYNQNSALSAQSYQQGLGLQENQNALNLNYDRNSFLAKAEGMKDAGLNPALMYGAQNTQEGGVSGNSNIGGNSARDLQKTRESAFKQFKTELRYMSKFMKSQEGKTALKAMKLYKQLSNL